MTLAFARRRFLFALLGLLAVGTWQGHDLMHCLGGEHHEEGCSLCELGLTPDQPPAPDLTTCLVSPVVLVPVSLPTDEAPRASFVYSPAIPRGPPSC